MQQKRINTFTAALLVGVTGFASAAYAYWNNDGIEASQAEWRAGVASLDSHGINSKAYLSQFDNMSAFNLEEASPLAYAMVADLRYGVTRESLSDEQRDAVTREAIDVLADCDQPAACLTELAARHEQYAPLLAKRDEYLNYAQNDVWPDIKPGKTLKPGMRDARVADVRNLLRLTGDMPADAHVADAMSEHYDVSLQEAVKSFQARHGLDQDGAVGPATLAALQVSPAKRAEQIALTLERLRRADEDASGKHIYVNIPSYELKAMDGEKVKLAMDVIVGRKDRETPIFSNSINRIVVNPTWTPTDNILRKDIMPKLRNNLDYIQNGGYKVYDRYSGEQLDVSAVDWHSMSARDIRVVQPAGNKNALGKVKFLLPDNQSVYLHDTSSPRLFSKADRALSSGCVRLSDPKSLLDYVLAAQGDTAKERGERAWSGSALTDITLSQEIPVQVTYYTTLINDEGKVAFYEDVYRQNDELRLAMSESKLQYAMREYKLATRPSDALAQNQYAQNLSGYTFQPRQR